MALRHGELPLPKINVFLLSSAADAGQSQPMTLETYQVRGAEKLLILPRGGKTTFVVNTAHERGLAENRSWPEG